MCTFFCGLWVVFPISRCQQSRPSWKAMFLLVERVEASILNTNGLTVLLFPFWKTKMFLLVERVEASSMNSNGLTVPLLYLRPRRPPSCPLPPPRAPHPKTTAFSLYAMAIRTVISTVGQPLRAAKVRRVELQAAAIAEKAASKLAEGADAVGVLGPAAEAAAREALEPMPFAYLPSVGALLMMLLAVGAHVLLVLGKRWSVRFNAW